MKIDSSRLNLFYQNPDRFRLRELCRLSPKEPAANTWAATLSFGRRRGTAFHELMDAAYRQVPENEAIESLNSGGFSAKEIEVATAMYRAATARYSSDEYLAHEVLFEAAIPNSPHSIVGRIDSVVRRDGEVFIRDYKTSKYRSKADLARKGEEYCRSTQVGFYLAGARSLGFDPTRFVYSVLHSGRDNSGISISEFSTTRTSLQLNELMRTVDQTCEMILWLKEKYGIQRSWPNLPERFTTGYEEILGHPAYPGFVPDGFEPKVDHLPIDLQMGAA